MHPKRITTGKIYNDYDRIIERVAVWIEGGRPKILGCDSNHVKARISQRIVELSCDAYTEHIVTQGDQVAASSPPSPPTIMIGGLKINIDTGTVAISPRQWVLQIALFAAVWGRSLVALLIAIFRRSPTCSVSATILMEAGGGCEESDERLVRFCRQGPIEPLRSAKHVIIRAPSPPRNPSESSFCYVKDPVTHLIATQLRWGHKITVLAQHLLAPVIFLHAVFSNPKNVLLSRDIAHIPVVRWLDQHALIDAIVITTSSFASQPLWMKGLRDQQFKLHMIWYSQNFIPKVYAGEEESSNLPSARHMRVDVHWVWTRGFKSFLQGLGQVSEVNIVGPILFYLPDNIQNFGDSSFKVAIFDVTPLPDGHRPFGALINYYSTSLMKKFVKDIVEVCKELENVSGKKILILLKHKRAVKAGWCDANYIDFIDQVISENSNLIMIDHQSNLFGLLNECDCSISVPYTSTAYVASALGKPALYYDAFGELAPKYESNEFVNFVSNEMDLRFVLEKFLAESSLKLKNK